MDRIRLGRTHLMASRTAFGAIPIQRLSTPDAVQLLRRAHEAGINCFDTARAYTDSEAKIGLALSPVRKSIILATKSQATTPETLVTDLHTSLKLLKTDYIDIYQLHNPDTLPCPGDPLYDQLLSLKAQGKIRHIGITNHDLKLAQQAVASGHYDTLQFPLSPLSSEAELALSQACLQADVGLIAMKALAGGLITQATHAFAFLRTYPNIVPIYGIQHPWELEEFIALEKDPPAMTEALWAAIDQDRRALTGAFCRGCGYCLPCPADIPIPTAARISLLLRRTNPVRFLTPEFAAHMDRVNNCVDCGHCRAHCPYGLDTPALLKRELAAFEKAYGEAQKKKQA